MAQNLSASRLCYERLLEKNQPTVSQRKGKFLPFGSVVEALPRLNEGEVRELIEEAHEILSDTSREIVPGFEPKRRSGGYIEMGRLKIALPCFTDDQLQKFIREATLVADSKADTLRARRRRNRGTGRRSRGARG